MDNFYKIKESMTEQHKKFLAELKKTYDDSLKNFKREEAEAARKVADINEEYQVVLSNLKKANIGLSKAKEEKAGIDAQIAVLRQEKADFDALRAKEEEGFREHLKQIVLDTQKLDEKSKAETTRIQVREKELLEIKTDGEVLLRRNEIVLSASKKADEDLTVKIQRFEDTKQDALEAETKLTESIKKNNGLLKEIISQKERNEAEKKEIENKTISYSKKEKTLGIRERQLDDKKQVLDDRELEIDVRDAELSKREKRINNLIEVHKIK